MTAMTYIAKERRKKRIAEKMARTEKARMILTGLPIDGLEQMKLGK